MWCKHTNYEQANRIPLIVCAPGIAPPGKRSAGLVETVDLYPSLCELAGLPTPAGLDGASFARHLKDPATKTKEAVFHVFPRHPKGLGELVGRAVRTERHRLVEWKVPGAAPETAILELYDYQEDPEETLNLAEKERSVVSQLRVILARQPEALPQLKAAAGGPAKPKQDRGAMFDRRDKNSDGKLTREEFLENQPDLQQATKRFPLFDTHQDGFLSREEFINGGRPAK
jgi:iduronate 2-sulfatase